MAAAGRSGPSGRERILEAALRLFSRKGFAATPTKEIAAEAGVAAGLLFYHFASKREILDALITERSLEGQFLGIVESLDRSEPDRAMRDLAIYVIDALRDNIDMVRVAFHAWLGEAGTPSELVRVSERAVGLIEKLADEVYRTEQGTHHLPAQLLFDGLVMRSLLSSPDGDRTFAAETVQRLFG